MCFSVAIAVIILLIGNFFINIDGYLAFARNESYDSYRLFVVMTLSLDVCFLLRFRAGNILGAPRQNSRFYVLRKREVL